MFEEVSIFCLYVMRALYLLNFLLVGLSVWPEIISHRGSWELFHGVAFSFYAALVVLSGLGIRYPLRMLPVLLMQLFYKSVWILAIALPWWSAFRPTGVMKVMVIGAVLDLIAIPWSYVLANYVKRRGDRWRSAPSPRAST
jgi:hypothetical protein